MTSRTPLDALHAAVVNLLDTLAAAVAPPRNSLTVLHLGCGVPSYLRSCRALGMQRIAYRGVDEDPVLVALASDEFPSLRYICRQLDAMPKLEADVILVGPGIFRLCGGGAEQLLRNLASARCDHLLIATVPGADHAGREENITVPPTHLPLDVEALQILHYGPPARLLRHHFAKFAYACWERR